MKRSVLWVWSLFTLAAACGGRSTDALEDESPDEPVHGAGGTQGMGGSSGAPGTAGAGGSQATAGSGGAQSTAGAGGTGGATSNGTKPLGEDQPCGSAADCAGFEATFCDIFVTGTCLVSGCSVAPDSCSAGKECCDLTAFGLPSLCIVAGACQN